ncbi:MAG: hypothetical protein HDS21_00865 [Bacteroides sp.]|nr:hypothetical protein [Bacteroides sp.]
MATLEKIRSKSALLLIIIGVALLAFIIGDFFKMHTLFGPDQSVASVDGKKIEAAEFQNRLNNANQNGAGNSDEERAYLNQQLLQQMLLEQLYQEEYDRLGMTVTDDELNCAVNGEGSMVGDYLAMQMSNGMFQSASMFRDYCFNPAKYGQTDVDARQLQQAWINFENQLEQHLLQTKFSNMLASTMVPNKLDLKQLYADANTGYEISFAKKVVAPDPNDKVTDEEIQKRWDAHKSFYRLAEESRLVGMITVPIVPSVADEEAARKEVKEVLDSLNTTPDLDALRGRKGFDSRRFTVTSSALGKQGDPKLKSFADSANVGEATMLQNGPTDFLMAKLLGKSSEVDTVTISFVVFQTEENPKADSIRTAIAAGKPAEDLRKLDSDLFAVDSVKVSLSNPVLADQNLTQLIGADLQAFKEAFINAEIGQAFQPDTASTSTIARYYTVNSRKAPEQTVELALVSFNLHPSTATINDLRAKLEQYVAKNNTAAEFEKNAAAANYNFNLYDISASNPYVMLSQSQQGPIFLPNSHAAAAWAIDAEKGQVSPIFGDERTGSFLVAALENVFTDYITTEHPTVKANLSREVALEKAATKAATALKGKGTDVATYATAMGVEPSTDVVNFYNSIYNYGPELLAQIVTTPKGLLVAPVAAPDGVVVYQVTEVNAPARALNPKTDEMLFMQRRGVGSLRNSEATFRMLLGDRKFTNRLVKVFNSAK